MSDSIILSTPKPESKIIAPKAIMPKFDIQKFAYHRDAEETLYRGRRRLSGSWGRVWLDGALLFEISAFECKVDVDREDVFIGVSRDSKVVSLTGSFTITVKKVFNRGIKAYLENQQKGIDPRFTLVCEISDPDAINSQKERISIENCWFNNLDILSFEKATVVENTLEGNFTPSDLTYLETIEL